MKKKYRPAVVVEVNGETIGIVPLTQGQFAIIDSEDAAVVSAYVWHAVRESGKYWVRTYRKNETGKWVRLMIQDLILGAPIHGCVWDHKDRNGLNNRRSNLRSATFEQNMRNKGPIKHRFKGVSFDNTNSKWIAQIASKRKNTFLGYFDSPEKAAIAYDKAATVRHGEFAYLNFSTATPIADLDAAGLRATIEAAKKKLGGAR